MKRLLIALCAICITTVTFAQLVPISPEEHSLIVNRHTKNSDFIILPDKTILRKDKINYIYIGENKQVVVGFGVGLNLNLDEECYDSILEQIKE